MCDAAEAFDQAEVEVGVCSMIAAYTVLDGDFVRGSLANMAWSKLLVATIDDSEQPKAKQRRGL